MKKRTKLVLLGMPVAVATGFAAMIVGLGLGFPRQKPIPVGPEDAVVEVLGSKIRYRDIEGSGPPLLLVHGNNLSIDDWEPMMEHLKGRRIVALDLIGYAGSDRPAGLTYDVECQRKYLIEFIEKVGLERPILIGHSMGGAVVAWTAAKSGEHLGAVGVIAPAGIPGSLIYRWPKSLLTRPGFYNRLGFAIADTALFRMVFPNTIAAQGLGVTGSYSEEFASELENINIPTLLVWSTGDDRCLISYASLYTERVKDLEFVEVPAMVGHMVPMKDPEGTARIIASFVDRLEAGKPAGLAGR